MSEKWGSLAMLILAFLVISVFFGGCMFLWAYGRGWELWKCGVFCVAAALVLFLLLLLLKAVLLGLSARFTATLPAVKLKLTEKIKGLL